MSKKIRGITIELGADASGIEKALKDVDKQLTGTQRELKDVERLLKMDPKNTELLKQKFDLLEKSVGDTKDKMDTLKKAEKEVQEQMKKGKASEQQYNALRREIIDTERKLGDLEGEAKATEKALNGIDESPIEDVTDAAKKAEKSLEDAGKEASSFGEHLKAEVVVEGAKSIVGALKDVAEESKEYMKIMGSLEVSSEAAGYSAEETEEIYKNLYGVLADEQSAATTTANLQALGIEQSKLQELTTGMIGAWAKYGDSIPIDGLAEAVNETVKAGQVTGNFADLLNWGAKEGETFGVKLKKATKANEEWNNAVKEAKTAEDFFNLALQDCANETERANLMMQFMADQGLTQMGEAWKENNSALIESNEANADMQKEIAELGETVMPVFTKITGGISSILKWFNSLDKETQDIIFVILGLVAGIGVLTQVFSSLGTMINFIMANPISLLLAAIVGLVALIAIKGEEIQAILQKVDDFLQGVFATDWSEQFGIFGEILNAFFATVKGIWDSIKQIFDGIINFIRGVFTGDWKRAWEGVKEIFAGVFGALETIVKAPLNGVIGLLNMAVDAINWLIDGINSIGFDLPDWLGGGSWHPDIPEIPNIPYLAKGGVLSQGSAIVGEAGPELLTMQGNSAVVQPLTNQTTKTTNLGGINIVIHSAPGQNVEELAELVSEKISDSVSRREAVYS